MIYSQINHILVQCFKWRLSPQPVDQIPNPDCGESGTNVLLRCDITLTVHRRAGSNYICLNYR